MIKAGLLAARPRTALPLELYYLLGIENHDPLAVFEGLFRIESPAYVAC